MRAQQATLTAFANALQSVLGKPVIDETGVAGNYNFEFPWGQDHRTHAATVAGELDRRFGLLLTAQRRSLDALVIDHADQSPALALMARMSRLSSRLPANLRPTVSRVAGGPR